MSNCTEVTIDLYQNNVGPYAGISIGGFVFGILLGFFIVFIYKNIFKEPNKVKSNIKPLTEVNIPNPSTVLYNTHAVYNSAKLSTNKSSSNEYETSSILKNIQKCEITCTSISTAVLAGFSTNQKSAFELFGLQELFELQFLDIKTWEDRIMFLKSILQITYRNLSLHTNTSNLTLDKFIELNDLDVNFNNFNKHILRYQGLKCNGQIPEKYLVLQEEYLTLLNNLACAYWNAVLNFKSFLEEMLPEDVYLDLSGKFQNQVNYIETTISEYIDKYSDQIRQLFRRYQVVLQAVMINEFSFKALKKSVISRQNSILLRLVKAGRISSQTKNKLIDDISDSKKQNKNTHVDEEFAKVLSEFRNQSFTEYKQTFINYDLECNKSMEHFVSEAALKLDVNKYIENILQVSRDKFEQRIVLTTELMDKEANALAVILKENEEVKNEKLMDDILHFCQYTVEHDALDKEESENMIQELQKEVKVLKEGNHKKLQSSIHRLWQQFDEKRYEKNHQETLVASIVLNDITTSNLENLKYFLEIQPLISNEKIANIFIERENILLLLGNLMNFTRILWFHIIESDLAKCQAILMNENSELLAENNLKKLEIALDKLWIERNELLKCSKETYSVTIIYKLIHLSNDILAMAMAKDVVNVLQLETLNSIVIKKQMQNITKLLLEELQQSEEDYIASISFLAENHKLECKKVAASHKELFDMQVKQIYQESSARQTFQQTQIVSKLKELGDKKKVTLDFDNLLLTHQLQMELLSTATYSLEARNSAIWQIKKDHKNTAVHILNDLKKAHICKVASECGVSKQKFHKIVYEGALNGMATIKEAKTVTQNFMKYWRKPQIVRP